MVKGGGLLMVKAAGLGFSCSLTCMSRPGMTATPGCSSGCPFAPCPAAAAGSGGMAPTAAPATARIIPNSSQGSTRVTLRSCTLAYRMDGQAGQAGSLGWGGLQRLPEKQKKGQAQHREAAQGGCSTGR